MIHLIRFLFLLAQPLSAQLQAPQSFIKNCSGCHGNDGRGTSKGPTLTMSQRVAEQSPEQLGAFLERGNVASGMPSFADLSVDERAALVRYVRRLNVDVILRPVRPIELARKVAFGPPRPGDWLTYNGNLSGNRYSPLKQITTANVSSLKLKWVFPIQYFGLETTPLAGDGVIYVTGPNQVFALDAVSGGEIWHYSRPLSSGMVGDSKLGTNRGVAILDDKVFFVTDNAHLLAIGRAGGNLLWDVPIVQLIALVLRNLHGTQSQGLVLGSLQVLQQRPFDYFRTDLDVHMPPLFARIPL
jgi:alcohol dehydrogenase (cytochrome c)